MERVQAYRTFKKLQEKGLIEATLERPTRFSIVSFEALLSSFIESKRSEVKNLNEQKESLLSSWRSVSAPEPDYPVAKYSVITGKKKIHSKMVNMIEESKKEIFILTAGVGVIHEDIAGVFDAVLQSAKKRRARFRILTDVSQENLNIIEGIYKKLSQASTDVECRHLMLSSKFFPRFMIKDEEEAILYALSGTDTSMLSLEDEGLWINDRMFISILKAFYTQLWQSAVDARLRIEELKTGIPLGETLVIKDSKEAWEKVSRVLEAAKQDVIAITSSQSINSLLGNDPFQQHLQKSLKFRIMAPIDLDNLEAAKKLSSHYEVKHVPISYLTMMLVDNKALFMFKTPPLSELASDSFFYLTDTFYTNDPVSIERVGEMLNDTWKRGTEISDISSQEGMEIPKVQVSNTETLSDLVSAILKNDVTSVLISENNKPVGLINDRDLLKEIVEKQKDPKKTLVRDLGYTPLLTLDDGGSITDILRTMREKRMKRAAVIRNGQLVGMLTEDLALRVKVAPAKTDASAT